MLNFVLPFIIGQISCRQKFNHENESVILGGRDSRKKLVTFFDTIHIDPEAKLINKGSLAIQNVADYELFIKFESAYHNKYDDEVVGWLIKKYYNSLINKHIVDEVLPRSNGISSINQLVRKLSGVGINFKQFFSILEKQYETITYNEDISYLHKMIVKMADSDAQNFQTNKTKYENDLSMYKEKLQSVTYEDLGKYIVKSFLKCVRCAIKNLEMREVSIYIEKKEEVNSNILRLASCEIRRYKIEQDKVEIYIEDEARQHLRKESEVARIQRDIYDKLEKERMEKLQKLIDSAAKDLDTKLDAFNSMCELQLESNFQSWDDAESLSFKKKNYTLVEIEAIKNETIALCEKMQKTATIKQDDLKQYRENRKRCIEIYNQTQPVVENLSKLCQLLLKNKLCPLNAIRNLQAKLDLCKAINERLIEIDNCIKEKPKTS